MGAVLIQCLIHGFSTYYLVSCDRIAPSIKELKLPVAPPLPLQIASELEALEQPSKKTVASALVEFGHEVGKARVGPRIFQV